MMLLLLLLLPRGEFWQLWNLANKAMKFIKTKIALELGKVEIFQTVEHLEGRSSGDLPPLSAESLMSYSISLSLSTSRSLCLTAYLLQITRVESNLNVE